MTAATGMQPDPLIGPYPSRSLGTLILHDGTPVHIRPIHPDDEAPLARFHATLSPQSVYFRYFSVRSLARRTEHVRLARHCHIDFNQQVAFVAERPGPNGETGEIIGVGRLTKFDDANQAEISVIVSDAFQRKGIGRALVARLLQFAREQKIDCLEAFVLVENPAMQRLLESQGFSFKPSPDRSVLHGTLPLAAACVLPDE